MKLTGRGSGGVGATEVWSPLELADMKTGRRIGQILRPKGFSARRRIKFVDRNCCYHVMSRTVNGERLFGAVEKEAFRRMMWRMAAFSGVEVLTYTVMDNHFHILAKVPDRRKWLARFEAGDGEKKLLDHLATVYSKVFIKQLKNEISAYRKQGNEAAVEVLLDRFKRRFCDISLFVKELKERFSRWFNKQQGRRGTLWMDRFKSVLVDGEAALATMAAYIDLNAVRAGLVDDPVAYEWSGYGEASTGSRRARRGLCKALNLPQDSWEKRALARYRIFLFDEGVSVDDPARPTEKKRRGVTPEARAKVQKRKGELTREEVLKKRIKSFSDGVAVGAESFVREVAALYQEMLGRKNRPKPKRQGKDEEGGGYFVMRE